MTAALPAWATLPPHDPSLTRVLVGNWWRAPGGSEEPDAVLVYATEPDPETGLIWLWQTRSGPGGVLVKARSSTLSATACDLLAWLQERPAAGEGSLKNWGQGRRPSLTLTQVEVRAAELVEANLVTREVLSDGRSKYRARERAPEPPPVEVTTEPELGWVPNAGAPVEPFYGVDRSPEPAATMRAEWAASARDTLPCAEAILAAETALWGAYPGNYL